MSEQAAYDLLRRSPPSKIEQRLMETIRLCPSLTDTLLQTVDVPLKLKSDAGTQFIACEFNRDLDSHRVPSTNKYVPNLPDGAKLSPRLLTIEQKANQAFGAYRQLYFQGGVSSVYIWEIDNKVLGLGVFIQNKVNTTLRTGEKLEGTINCSDVVEIEEARSPANYTLTASVLLTVSVDIGLGQPLTVSGSTSDRRTIHKPFSNDEDHIINAGELIESNASVFREKINTVYSGVLKHIIEIMVNEESSSAQKTLADALRARLGK
jgi:capping protein beta